MQIESILSSEMNHPGQVNPSGSDSLQLSAGDRIPVTVLFNEGGTVHLKTEDGQIIRARLEGELPMPPGSKVTMVVSEYRDGTFFLSVDGNAGNLAPPGHPAAGLHIAPDDRLAALITKLDSLGYPVTKETVSAMQEVLSAHPDMSLDEAAFLAVNRMVSEPGLIQPARNLLSGEEKTADLLKGLIQLLENAHTRPVANDLGKSEGVPNWEKAFFHALEGQLRAESEAVRAGAPPDTGVARSAGEAEQSGWTKLITALIGHEKDASSAPAGVGQTAVIAGEPSAGPLVGRQAAAQDESPAMQPGGRAVQEDAAATRPEDGAEPAVRQTETTALPKISAETAHPAKDRVANPAAERLFSVLADLPESKGVPQKTLIEFAQTLALTAREAGIGRVDNGSVEGRLRTFVENMFAALESAEKDPGGQLKEIREQLYLKLSVLRAAIEQADIAGKPQALQQAQRAMEHVRVQNSVEQYIYMQLPITLNKEQKNAELYIFRQKKGARKIDPDNIRILLALDLSNMGHLEAFVNIRGKEVALQMEVDDRDAQFFFRQNTIALHQLLAEAGYKLADLKVGLSDRAETSVETALLSLKEFEKRIPTGFDLTI